MKLTHLGPSKTKIFGNGGSDNKHILFGKMITEALEGDRKVKDRYKHLLDEKNKLSNHPMYKPTRTEFEQKAYDMQFRKKNRVSGPELGQEPDIQETRSDRDILFSVFIFILFVILLFNV